MKDIFYKTCKNCGSMKFKTWEQLTEDEKFVINKLPNENDFSDEQIKKQHFCKRCLYVFIGIDSQMA